ncbi:MAG: hypothetical protein WBK91_04195 [Alphaproteobacteria bacterium]
MSTYSVPEILAWCTLAAELGLIAVLSPELLRHLAERKERKARISLNIEVLDPKKINRQVYGLSELTAQIGGLLDRVKHPEAYAGVDSGNEILIVGPEQGGKKALAFHIARETGIDRIIVVYNPRDADVLARAKSMIEDVPTVWQRVARTLTRKKPSAATKTMLLLPGLNPVAAHHGAAWLDQLAALIETAGNMPNVLIVGTAETSQRNGEVASWFGTTLALPESKEAWNKMLEQIAHGYLDAALSSGYVLSDIPRSDFVGKLLAKDPSPAEINDTLMHCEAEAIYASRRGAGGTRVRAITPEILENAITRAIPRAAVPSRQASVDASQAKL